jgi:hypothetical protein
MLLLQTYESKCLIYNDPTIIELAARGIDPNNAPSEDELFIDNAGAAICKLFSEGSHNNLEGDFVD